MGIDGDALNRALGDELRAAVLDRHREFPNLADFADAVAARGLMSAVTVGRLLRANTTIRVDYLCELCAVLGVRASVLLRNVEQSLSMYADTDGAGPSPSVESLAEFERLANRARPSSDGKSDRPGDMGRG